MTDEHEYMTTEEVAEKLRTTAETVRYWRHEKKGPPSFKVGRRVLYAREDVERFIANARRPNGTDQSDQPTCSWCAAASGYQSATASDD